MLIGIKEAAKQLGVSYKILKDFYRSGKINGVLCPDKNHKHRIRIFFTDEEIDRIKKNYPDFSLICCRCGDIKIFESFKNPNSHMCSDCCKLANSENYKKDRNEFLKRCKEYRELNPEKIIEYRFKNKDFIKKYASDYYAQNYYKLLSQRRFKRYNITEEQFIKLFESQNKCCAICLIDTPYMGKQSWCVDHDHDTGLVRGILCHKCNVMLGNANDNIERLLSGINYLKNPPSHVIYQTKESCNKMKIFYQTPILTSITSKNLKKFWQGKVLYNPKTGEYWTATRYWQSLKDGSLSVEQESAPYLVKKKNVGKANETSLEQQAMLEINATILKQKDKGYLEEGETKKELVLPMLAYKYEDRKHTLSSKVFVSEKRDGSRALYDGNKMWSRRGKPLIPEVYAHIKEIFDPREFIVDGELMLPLEAGDFSAGMSAVKKFGPLSRLLEYHVFDIVMDAPFPARLQVLKDLLKSDGLTYKDCSVKLLDSIEIDNDEDKINEYHVRYVENGHEGVMIRSSVGGYVVGQRSVQLLKKKFFEDGEYPIIGVLEGEAKEAGCAIFVCKTPEGKSFKCRPKGTVEYRRQLFKDGSSLLGKMLTVSYQNLSEDGIPRFPVGTKVNRGDI